MGKSQGVEVSISSSAAAAAPRPPSSAMATPTTPTAPGAGAAGSASSIFSPTYSLAADTNAAPPPSSTSEPQKSSNTSLNSLSRRMSKSFQESELPYGFLAATAEVTSSVFTAARSRSGTVRTRSSSTSDNNADGRPGPPPRTGTGPRAATAAADEAMMLGTLEENQRERRTSSDNKTAALEEETVAGTRDSQSQDANSGAPTATECLMGAAGSAGAAGGGDGATGADGNRGDPNDPLYKDYDNGYHFPPKYSTGESLQHGAVAFWKYMLTPVGFLVVLYGLNVVAWGGMLFLLLCNASPAMCHPSCNNINSPRRVWIEIDSQILNALFCVTGFGLAPWRFRDLWYLLAWRLRHDYMGLRRLAGIHRGWLRLPGSEDLPVDVGPGHIPSDTPETVIPFPPSKIPDAPLTGVRAPPTTLWKVDFVLWMNVGNTFLQCVLSGFMWGMNRYNRPSWSTGLFVALGCMAGAIGGLGMFVEGKRVKGIEGVPLTPEDYAKLAEDRRQGIYHYNNLKGKKPKDRADDEEAVPLEALPPQ